MTHNKGITIEGLSFLLIFFGVQINFSLACYEAYDILVRNNFFLRKKKRTERRGEKKDSTDEHLKWKLMSIHKL